ncbi:outer membrane beta-barrel family protein [Pedobacter sp. Hv1]|uniref:outer membrane beta-barrel family protein n=1 Tax=Pedobacter sp. Hv1 TaxID=1740090 RepID=UPI0006D8B4DE|nr:outer membrane beta-barrel family protein [Pedobacter sp. Hv1]KQC02740.1 TonB-dependent receptor [Pedobacter sp. Hv1]
MKKIILLCAGLMMMFGAQAQFPGMGGGAQKVTVTGRITALVLDSLTKQPIDYATVSLIKVKDNKTVNGGLTDDKGKIVLQNIAPDEYKLVVGFIGYKSKTMLVKTTPEKLDNNVGNVFIVASSNTLNEITVEGKKAMIENKIDRLVYNAEADGTNVGGDATDVMRKVPMLSVDMNGNLQLRGAAVRVLINGKPSGTMANSVADALKMMPAEQIKSVEVITSPSAKYDAEGSGGIVNIITKKSNAQGVSGSLNTTAGTRQNNGSFNLTAKTGRLSMNTALGGNYAFTQNTRVLSVNNTKLNSGGTNSIQQDGVSKWDRSGFNGSLGLDYDFNAYNNISTNAKFNRFSNGGPGESNYIINGVASKNISSMDASMNNLDWNVDYRKTSKKAGEEFSISAQLSTGRAPQTFSNSLTSPLYPGALETFSSNTGKNNEYTAQTDYTYPFSKATTLEVGAKGIFRNFNSQFDAAAKDFKYNQNVASVYSVISFNLTKKLQVKGGVRGEYTKIDFNTKTSGTETNDYLNLFPSVIVAQTLKGSSMLKLSYNRRVQRPSQIHLNPFRNEADQFNIMQGNPQLNPELSDNLELAYSTYIKGSIINASIFYRRTNGIIENSISPIVENGVNKTLTSYINVGSLKTFGFNIFGSYNPKPKWTLMSSIGMNSYDINSELVDVSKTYYMFNIFARSAYAFGKGWNLELFGVATSPRRTYQGKTNAFYFYGGTVKKDILNKKGSIGFNVLNPFTRDLEIKTQNNAVNSSGTVYQNTQIFYPLRSFNLAFSYSFGKLKFTEKKKIKNDDVKQDQQGGGQMGGVQQ